MVGIKGGFKLFFWKNQFWNNVLVTKVTPIYATFWDISKFEIFYIFRSAWFSFKAISIGQHSKFFILRARIFIFTASAPARSPDHFAHLVCQNRMKNKRVMAKTVFPQIAREPLFLHKTGSEKSNFEDNISIFVLYSLEYHHTL